MVQCGTERIIEIVKGAGIFRPKELEPYGIPREYLSRLYRAGVVQRVGRGLYTLPNAEVSEHYSLAQMCKRVPHGVICLLSALRFHNLTTQPPFEVWMAIDVKARKPKVEGLPLHIVRFSGQSLRFGIDEHLIQGVTVRVYGPAKTVADCFKYRNKIGLDVALEALRECLRERGCTMDDLWHYAKICRIANVMRPYMESLA
ncbi:MAG: type IV toxin-antitoxin system AbiEi family antitoxin domain-containing protein [Syntrophobacteraceae bacterium]|nr:type IV toxin-antitoxin system AbiEi family antitoxin domain-containing protein [Syntrophobacteraceae bacterium]